MYFTKMQKKILRPLMKILFPMTNSSMEISLPSNPTQPPPSNQKNLKESVYFPKTIAICKHWSKFLICSPSHGDCEVESRPQRHGH